MNNKNSTFFIVIFLLIYLLGIFNYIQDPYDIFHVKKTLTPYPCPEKFIYSYIDTYKDYKMTHLVVGGSDAGSLFGNKPHIKKDFPVFYTLVVGGINKQQEYELLKYCLDVHKEIGFVFIVSSFYNLSTLDGVYLPEIPKSKFDKIKQKIIILYSYETLRDSIQKITSGFQKEETGKEDQLMEVFPVPDEEALIRAEKTNFEYTKKIKDLLNEKNIKYKVVIPPYNAAFLYLNNSNPVIQKYIDRNKRFLVENFDEIYDFAFINKYTSTKIYNENNYYFDMMHITYFFGDKVFKYFFDNKNAEKDICLILNKDNIDNMISYENQLLENFVKSNPDFTQFYNKVLKQPEN